MTNRNFKAFCFYHVEDPSRVVDLVRNHPFPFQKAYGRKHVLPAGRTTVSIACLDDLIVMKRAAGRPKDLSDVEMLEEARRILGEA